MYILSKEEGLFLLGEGIVIVQEDDRTWSLVLEEWCKPGQCRDMWVAQYETFGEAQKAVAEIAGAYAKGVKVFEL